MEKFQEIKHIDKRIKRLQSLSDRRSQINYIRSERFQTATDPIEKFRHAHAIDLNNQHISRIPEIISELREQQISLSLAGLSEYEKLGVIPSVETTIQLPIEETPIAAIEKNALPVLKTEASKPKTAAAQPTQGKTREYTKAAQPEVYGAGIETLTFPDGQTVERKSGVVNYFFRKIVEGGKWNTDLVQTYDDYKTNPEYAMNRVYMAIKSLDAFAKEHGYTIQITTEGKGSPKFYELVLMGKPQVQTENVPQPEITKNMLTLEEGARLAAFIKVNYDILKRLGGFEEMHEEFTKATSTLTKIEPVLSGKREAHDFTLATVRKVRKLIETNGFGDCCELAELQLPQLRDLFEYILLMQHDKNPKFLSTLEQILTKGVDSITVEERLKDSSKNRVVTAHYRQPNFEIEETALATKATTAIPTEEKPIKPATLEPVTQAADAIQPVSPTLPHAEVLFDASAAKPEIKPAKPHNNGIEERFPEANRIIGETISFLIKSGKAFDEEFTAAQITRFFKIRRTYQEQLEGKKIIATETKGHSGTVYYSFEHAVRLQVFKELKAETLDKNTIKELERLISEAILKARNHSH
jgi:hypothetical protein